VARAWQTNEIDMKEHQKFKVHAKKYQTLARGYAALKSNLAEPAKGAAEAYARLADEVDEMPRVDTGKQKSERVVAPD
jgi:hypothetical protein